MGVPSAIRTATERSGPPAARGGASCTTPVRMSKSMECDCGVLKSVELASGRDSSVLTGGRDLTFPLPSVRGRTGLAPAAQAEPQADQKSVKSGPGY